MPTEASASAAMPALTRRRSASIPRALTSEQTSTNTMPVDDDQVRRRRHAEHASAHGAPR